MIIESVMFTEGLINSRRKGLFLCKGVARKSFHQCECDRSDEPQCNEGISQFSQQQYGHGYYRVPALHILPISQKCQMLYSIVAVPPELSCDCVVDQMHNTRIRLQAFLEHVLNRSKRTYNIFLQKLHRYL